MNLPNMKDAKLRTNREVLTENFEFNKQHTNFVDNQKYHIKTYGCQMNEHDSENIKALVESIGYIYTDEMEAANLIILNTCAIRENAHNKVFGMIGRIKHLKETRKDIITCLCGCMAQEEQVVIDIKNKYQWIDIVFGTHNIYDFPEMLIKRLNENKNTIDVYSIEGKIIEGLPVKRDNKYKAWINIMYGCDKFCTYCIVPYTRGKQRSRNKNDILEEIKDLIENGYQEVTLLGQNVNAYGKDLNDNYTMVNLLEDVSKTGIKRIRFMTSHPWDFSDEMIKVIKDNSNIMPYVHLPVQSGSNRILKLMGRRYSKTKYLQLFNKLKKNIPNMAISTDIIVGFPTETADDFAETLNIVNTCKFDFAYTFIYSPREATPASQMQDDVSIDIKRKRLGTLNALVNRYALENNIKLVNQSVSVLIEGYNPKDNKLLFGYTDTMKLVNITGDDSYIGKVVEVIVTEAKSFCLYGKIK